MKTISRSDLDSISALSPRAVVAYLESKGWTRGAAYGEHGTLVERIVDDKKQELIVPTSPTTRDFARAMSLAVDDLAGFEDRSPYDIVRDLGLAPYDVVHVRSFEADDLGSITLSAGVELHEQARAVFAAAANAAAAPTPRAYWQGRPFEKVESYMSVLRLGQTQRGSFVLSLLSPWDFETAPNLQIPLLLEDAPFGRLVTRTLGRAFFAVQHALSDAVRGDVATAFTRAVADGVSVNLCDALAALVRKGGGVDLSINWSLTKPEGEARTLSLRREDAQTLTEARRMLAEVEPSPEITVEGFILQITNDLGSFDGRVAILALVNGTVRKVRATFREIDRRTVFDAGQQQLSVQVTGRLVRRGHWLELENPHGLTLISPTDDESGLEATPSPA